MENFRNCRKPHSPIGEGQSAAKPSIYSCSGRSETIMEAPSFRSKEGGWDSPTLRVIADNRQNLQVVGSNPTPATFENKSILARGYFCFFAIIVHAISSFCIRRRMFLVHRSGFRNFKRRDFGHAGLCRRRNP